MYLHEDKDLFREAVMSAATALGQPVPIVEKDYYVTMILKLLSERAPACVFKGGTSLSKCHHAIDRFSEDIDITFSENLSQGQRKRLKNEIILSISEELGLPISDWEDTRSRRDYNRYTFSYTPLSSYPTEALSAGVMLETALGSIAFPTEQKTVDSLVYQFLMRENADVVEEYGLQPFTMTVQTLDRTLIDKVFALCDYYLEGQIKRHSRHIYDIYMLMPKVVMDDAFATLVEEVRAHRAKMTICPSAQPGVSISCLLKEILDKGVYRQDYDTITNYFQNHPLPYDKAIKAIQQIIDFGIFDSEEKRTEHLLSVADKIIEENREAYETLAKDTQE